ncbi:hypothetical protein BZA70DRAFT_284724, partial [Myxozyma melibiosi]
IYSPLSCRSLFSSLLPHLSLLSELQQHPPFPCFSNNGFRHWRGTRPSSASHTAAAFYMHRRCRHLPTYAQPRLESAFAGYPTTERGYGRLQPSTCFAAHDDDDL